MYIYSMSVGEGGGAHVYVLRMYVCDACVYMRGVLSLAKML